jgi:hypothetical protein
VTGRVLESAVRARRAARRVAGDDVRALDGLMLAPPDPVATPLPVVVKASRIVGRRAES